MIARGLRLYSIERDSKVSSYGYGQEDSIMFRTIAYERNVELSTLNNVIGADIIVLSEEPSKVVFEIERKEFLWHLNAYFQGQKVIRSLDHPELLDLLESLQDIMESTT